MTQRYFGSKIVTAWSAEQAGEPGYAVKYADGYTSWSPKATFEDSYLSMGNSDSLAGWQERIVAEMVQLEDRVSKLTNYLSNPTALANLDPAAITLLQEQLDVMIQYSEILGLRADLHGISDVWTGPED